MTTAIRRSQVCVLGSAGLVLPPMNWLARPARCWQMWGVCGGWSVGLPENPPAERQDSQLERQLPSLGLIGS